MSLRSGESKIDVGVGEGVRVGVELGEGEGAPVGVRLGVGDGWSIGVGIGALVYVGLGFVVG